MENGELMVRTASAPVVEAVPEPTPAGVIPEPTPITPAVMPMPESPFRVSGNLASDVKAVKADTQTKLFATLSKLSLKEALTLRELLDQVIEEREAEAEPA